MKQCNYIMFIIISLFNKAYATPELENNYCYNNVEPACEIILKETKIINEANYNAIIIDSDNLEPILPGHEENTTMESVSLYKTGQGYVLLKEYFDSTRALEFIYFKYDHKKPQKINYYYIESSIDFNNRLKKWSGKQCSTEGELLSFTQNETILTRFSSMCDSILRLPYHKNNHANNDVFFGINKISDGKLKTITLVALDSKSKSSINIHDVGCSANCDPITNSANFIGKLNSKIRVGIHLIFKGNIVTGYYYYDKVKKLIPLVGEKNGDYITLTAKVESGEEKFKGVINNGQFKGQWENASGNKLYPFEFYLMLFQ